MQVWVKRETEGKKSWQSKMILSRINNKENRKLKGKRRVGNIYGGGLTIDMPMSLRLEDQVKADIRVQSTV